MKSGKLRLLILGLILATYRIVVSAGPGQGLGKDDSLQRQIARLQQDSDLVHASWSISVLDITSDSVILEYNSHLTLIPASTYKIITTASALALLGWDFKYETSLEYDGVLDSSGTILHGNLYIKGSGDPTLASETFKKKSDTISLTDQWAKIIFARGIRKIDGAVIGDGLAFEDEMPHSTWIWGDIGNYYGSGTCGLNFMDNKFTLYFKSGPSNGDSTAIMKIFPVIPGMRVLNQTFTKGYSDNAYIYGVPYSMERYVKGTIPCNKTNHAVAGSQPDPPLFCAQSLDGSLKKLGITIAKKPRALRSFLPVAEELNSSLTDSMPHRAAPALPKTNNEKIRKVMYVQISHTLDKIVSETNIQSNNLFAESLLKTIAWKKTQWGDSQTGTEIVANFWKSKGINLSGASLTDGCGLSRFDAVSTKQLSEILRVITLDSILFNKFYTSLPIAGKSGSLGALCKGTVAENNLHAKSGYMTRVRSYAGYVTTKSHKLLAFAIIVNNYDCSPIEMKKKLEKVMISIAEIE
jgi:serine-type D-Ala-D-Ala carboxypeptidase/endopeptidase (penicillin-binding protein 4)